MTGEFEYPTSSQPVLGCLDSYGKKSWILVDFLVDPIVHRHVHVYTRAQKTKVPRYRVKVKDKFERLSCHFCTAVLRLMFIYFMFFDV